MVSERYDSMDRELQMTYSAFDYMVDDRIQQKDESRKKEVIDIQSSVANFKQQFLDQLTTFRRDLVEMIREEANIIGSQSDSYIENPTKSGGSSLLNIASGGSTSSDEEAVYTPESNYDSIKVTTTTGVEEAVFLQASNVSRESMVTMEATVHEGEEIEEKSMEDNEEGDSIDYCESNSNQNGSEIQSHRIPPIVHPQSPTTIPPTLEANTSITGVGHNRSRASPTVAFSSIIEWNKSRWERIEGRMWIPDRRVPMEVRKGGEITKVHVEDSFMAQAHQVILNWPKHEPVILNWPKPTSNLICTFPLPTCSILSTSDGRDGWSDDQRRLPPPPLRPPLSSSAPPSPPSSAFEGEVGFKAPLNITLYLGKFRFVSFSKEESANTEQLPQRYPDANSHVEVFSCVVENREIPYHSYGHVIPINLVPILFYPISSTKVCCWVDKPGQQPPLTNGKMVITLSNVDGLQPLHDLTNVESFPKYINSFYTLCKARASIRKTLAGVLNKVLCGSPNETMKEMQIACFVCLSFVDGGATGPVALLSRLNLYSISLVLHFLTIVIYSIGHRFRFGPAHHHPADLFRSQFCNCVHRYKIMGNLLCLGQRDQYTVVIIETDKNSDNVITLGYYCVLWIFGSQLVSHLKLRFQQLAMKCGTKTKDKVFVNVVVSIQYCDSTDKASETLYKLSNIRSQLQVYDFDVIRACIPKPNLEKDDIAKTAEALKRAWSGTDGRMVRHFMDSSGRIGSFWEAEMELNWDDWISMTTGLRDIVTGQQQLLYFYYPP